MLTIESKPMFNSLSDMGEYIIMTDDERKAKYPDIGPFDITPTP